MVTVKKKKKKRGHCRITLKGYISCKSILKFSIRHWLIDPDFSDAVGLPLKY